MDDVQIIPHNPMWPILFDAEAATLRQALNPDLILSIEHFGSTAVPGLAAKPIIDIMILTSSLARCRNEAVPALEALRYAFWSESPQVDRLFFVKGLPPNGPRTHHIHIVSPDTLDARSGGHAFADRLLFRDYLRAHSDEAARYEKLKRDVSYRFRLDREAYTDAKSDYVQSVMRRATAEPSI